MATLKYIRLVNAAATLDKKFRVLFQDYREPIARRLNVREMGDGGLDFQIGAQYRMWPFALKVYVIDPDATSGYGNLADIKTFFGYKTPSTITLTFYDNYGVQYSVCIINDFDLIHQTSSLDGSENWAIVPIILRKTTKE